MFFLIIIYVRALSGSKNKSPRPFSNFLHRGPVQPPAHPPCAPEIPAQAPAHSPGANTGAQGLPAHPPVQTPARRDRVCTSRRACLRTRPKSVLQAGVTTDDELTTVRKLTFRRFERTHLALLRSHGTRLTEFSFFDQGTPETNSKTQQYQKLKLGTHIHLRMLITLGCIDYHTVTCCIFGLK